MGVVRRFYLCIFLHFLCITTLTHCIRSLDECSGPSINLEKVKNLRARSFSASAAGYLVLNDPIDATGNNLVTSSSAQVAAAVKKINLPNLSMPLNRLENSFLKMRHKSISDTTGLAQVNGSQEFNYPVSDTRNSEVMGWYGVNFITDYIEALGYSLLKNRNLFFMVAAEDSNFGSSYVNAFYSHNFFDPASPREISFFGNGDYAPAKSLDVILHEVGHYINESVSKDVGIDRAGEYGARSEGGILHECLADYWAESLLNRDYIGKWINRNFSSAAGTPLRSALEANDGKSVFKSVITFSASSGAPKKYDAAEWCSRVLYRFESYLRKESPELGSIVADRLVLKALSSLKKDTSFSEFRSALIDADQQYHCGLHKNSISESFSYFGFDDSPDKLSKSLTLKATPTAYLGETYFNLEITNSSAQTARNVRVLLESTSGSFLVNIYQQAFGDLPGGQKITVGGTGISLDNSVSGQKDTSVSTPAKYRVSVLIENGDTSSVEGVVP